MVLFQDYGLVVLIYNSEKYTLFWVDFLKN